MPKARIGRPHASFGTPAMRAMRPAGKEIRLDVLLQQPWWLSLNDARLLLVELKLAVAEADREAIAARYPPPEASAAALPAA